MKERWKMNRIGFVKFLVNMMKRILNLKMESCFYAARMLLENQLRPKASFPLC